MRDAISSLRSIASQRFNCRLTELSTCFLYCYRVLMSRNYRVWLYTAMYICILYHLEFSYINDAIRHALFMMVIRYEYGKKPTKLLEVFYFAFFCRRRLRHMTLWHVKWKYMQISHSGPTRLRKKRACNANVGRSEFCGIFIVPSKLSKLGH